MYVKGSNSKKKWEYFTQVKLLGIMFPLRPFTERTKMGNGLLVSKVYTEIKVQQNRY